MAAAHPPGFQLFSLKDDAGGLRVAEEANEILGFAWSWVCGDLWFLAQLFVSPDHQPARVLRIASHRAGHRCVRQADCFDAQED
jgi:hypothetical protein